MKSTADATTAIADVTEGSDAEAYSNSIAEDYALADSDATAISS